MPGKENTTGATEEICSKYAWEGRVRWKGWEVKPAARITDDLLLWFFMHFEILSIYITAHSVLGLMFCRTDVTLLLLGLHSAMLLLLLLSHFSRVRLCATRDGSPSGSPVPGILQARTLEWVAISFSNAWKWKVKVKLLSRVQLLATPQTAT